MNDVLVEQMAMYSAYHRDPRNRATHFVGVPAIAFAILIPMGWVEPVPGAEGLSLALIFTLGVLGYYLWLDRPLAFATAAVYLPILALAQWVAHQGTGLGWSTFGAFFVGGWILQLVGHAFEGRKPALVDNLMQIFIAPLFLMAEIFVAVGLHRELGRAVRERSAKYLPQAGGEHLPA